MYEIFLCKLDYSLLNSIKKIFTEEKMLSRLKFTSGKLQLFVFANELGCNLKSGKEIVKSYGSVHTKTRV